MKKDIEWLKKEVRNAFSWGVNLEEGGMIRAVDMDYVIKLIDQLDEPEKVVIPQFVAEWIERQKKYEPEPVITAMNRLRSNGTRELMIWFESNPDVYARAWLDGYEVEKEPMWVVKYEDGYFSEEINFGCGIDGDWVDEVSRAYHFTDKSKAEAVALLIGGTVEEVQE